MALSMLFIILIIHSMILITKNNKVIAEQNLLCLRFLFLYQGASYSVLFLENKEILQGNKIGVYLTIVNDVFFDRILNISRMFIVKGKFLFTPLFFHVNKSRVAYTCIQSTFSVQSNKLIEIDFLCNELYSRKWLSTTYRL
jgi:hypothetical protein